MGSTPPKLVSRQRWAWRIIGVVVSIPVILLVAHHWALARKINRKTDLLRAAGVPVSLSALNTWYAAIPDSQNAGLVYTQAFRLVENTKDFTTLKHLTELPSGRAPLPRSLHEKMESALDNNREALAQLKRGNALNRCRYPIDYNPGYRALLPHLRQVQACSQLLLYFGVIEEQNDQVDLSIDAIEDILKLCESLDLEPDLISLLIQSNIDFQANELARWLLNHREFSEKQLQRLQDLFQQHTSTKHLQRALVGERCTTLAVFGYSGGETIDLIDPQYNDRGWAVLGMCVLRLTGTLKADELYYLSKMEECQNLVELAPPANLDLAERIGRDIKHNAGRRRYVITGCMLPPFLKVFTKTAERVARRRLVRTALAIERYRASNSTLPSTISETLLSLPYEILEDPFDGQPLRYRRTNEGFYLYSIGPDRKDDFGNKQVSLNPLYGDGSGDIVFKVGN